MYATDRRRNELLACNPPATIDKDKLDLFWSGALEKHGRKPLDVRREPAATPFKSVRAERLTFAGHDDTPIRCWLLIPDFFGEDGGQKPCVVTFPGYTGDRGNPERYAGWLLQGFAVLAVDARGQGGETGSLLTESSGSVKGWVSRGITDIENSYYLAITMDAVRAVDAAARQPEIDASRIATVGASQGGGLSLLAAALNPKVGAVVADIPNMCHMDHGVLHSGSSLSEIAAYVKRYPDRLNAVMETIAHFDLLNLAERIEAPVLMSVGWKDTVCLPETVYAVYNRIRSGKRINDYPYSGHEVSEFQTSQAYAFLREAFGLV
ncbi:acetylxylan esterase [Paenibacillus arenilitoris]|uniref:acetylxylan esterase n=1 Tax=Paenibacillus arenilitoris TaxID=2772299 RepID=UPI0037CAE9E1